ncbi:leucine-rich repeat protein 1 [Scleropages formosus]|uniref:Leucine rich repeat protein 1 n=1 Tax=Scleropages formosus TaxID=113540 RepID=A0A8C9S368_SCLFO|nr:leucine-rich repeat protein 1 [Scleropages formosus]
MRLQCDVEVVNRMLPTCGMRSRGKGTRAVLSIGRHVDKTTSVQHVYLLICTGRDKAGTKYKLKENIEKFFTLFVDEGKATVRLKEPAVDVCLSKANVNSLKNFLSAARLADKGNDTEVLPLSTLVPIRARDVERPKKKLTIHSQKEYPLTSSFPSSLEQLAISYCRLSRVDTRVLSLQCLRRLDLSNNYIKRLPAALGDLAFLAELILTSNHLEAFPVTLCHSGLQHTLQYLDLSQNHLVCLPIHFGRLRELVQLKLDSNRLTQLPPGFGRLTKLQSFSATHNQLPFLPSDFLHLRLQNLDLFGNPFNQNNPFDYTMHLTFPLTLLEMASRAVVNHRIPYGPQLIPAHLCEDLELAKRCDCGEACLGAFIETAITMNMHLVSHTVVLVDDMAGTDAPVQRYFCSLTCYSAFLDSCLQRGLR